MLLLLIALAASPASTACTKIPKGPIIWREQHSPLVYVENGPQKVPTTIIEIYQSGYFTIVQSGEAGSNEALGRSGCLASAQPFAALLKAATFGYAANSVCDAVPMTKLVYEAPLRKKKIATETPCGSELDKSTQALVDAVRNALAAAERSR
ncbi:MAG: hypothetical protein IT381_01555 [Deltaproteobacteria bacterium]|nr:hypothetical protein [Deltaproteobacteria bacterium]